MEASNFRSKGKPLLLSVRNFAVSLQYPIENLIQIVWIILI